MENTEIRDEAIANNDKIKEDRLAAGEVYMTCSIRLAYIGEDK